MTTQYPRIYADFQNADNEGYVRLNCRGTLEDLTSLGIDLREGLLLELSDGELTAVGEVSAPSKEEVWRARIDWSVFGR